MPSAALMSGALRVNIRKVKNKILGPGLQTIFSLISLLMTNPLTVLIKLFSDILIFLLQKCK